MKTIYSRIKLIVLLSVGVGFSSIANSQTIVVTNTADSGPGSLRNACTTAAAGTTILFDPGIANQTITLLSTIVPNPSLTIDGEDKNMTISGGGSVKIFDATSAVTFDLFRITLTQGQGSIGGALGAAGGCSVTAEYVRFINNNSNNDGGAIRIQGGTQTFVNCEFSGNNAPAWGGAYYQLTGTVNFTNCLFSGNRGANGGALFVRGASTITNCTFSGNRANNATGGGALYLFNGANIQIVNSIFWNNQSGSNIGTQAAFYTMDSGSPSFFGSQDCIIEGSGGSVSWNASFGVDGGGNIDANPLFANQISPGSAPTSTGNYRPQLGSPAHDSGDNFLNSTASELDQHNRIIYGTIDMGCYEFCTTTSTTTLTVCDSYNSPGGNVYTASGVYYDTLSNYLGCDSVITTNLTVDQTAIVDAGINQTLCANNPAVTLSGSVLNAAGGNWTSSGSGGFSPTSTTLNGTYNPSAADVTGGTVTLTLTSTGNGVCPAQSQDIVITYTAGPIVNAGPDATVCEESPDVGLVGAVGNATGGLWSSTGGGTFNPSNTNLSTIFTPSASEITAGTATVILQSTGNGTCLPEYDTLIVTIIPTPTVNAGINQTVCEGTAVTLTGSGTATAYNWDNGVVDGSPFTPTVGTTTYTVTGTDGFGCMATDQVDVTVNALPTVSYAGAFPVLCENDAPFTLTQGTPAGGTYSGTGVTGNSFDPGMALAGSHPIIYTYTDGNTCTDSVTQNILVEAIPNVVATGTTTICDGVSTNITATGANSYNWNQGIGAGQSHVVTPSSTTTYTVTGTALNGCTNLDSVTITVNPLPTVSFAALSPLCVTASPYSFVEGSPSGGVYSGPGVASGAIDPPVAGVGTHTIYYNYTDLNGCSNTDSSDIQIYAGPTVVANASATAICDGDVLTLTGSGANSYAWNNGVNDGVSFNPPVGSYYYTVTGTDLNGCTGVDSIAITINALPNVSAGADQTVCDGDQVTLSGAGAVSYVWDNGVSDGVAFTPTVGTTVYIVTGTDGNGCENTDTVNVIVNPNPILTVSPDQIFCLGDTVTLTASGADSYDWDSGSATTASYQISPNSSVTVSVTGYNSFSCQSTETIDLILDDPNVIDAGADQTICEGFTANLSASGGDDYEWIGPGLNEFTQDISFSVDTTAYYYAMVTTTNGCVYTDSVLVSINTDPACTIETVTSITPNNDGVNDFWKILGIEGFPDNHVVIYNRWGDIVFDETGYDNDLIKWDGMRNGKVLGAGTYFYLIEITNGPSQSGWVQLMK